jgi:hypothetical protein
MSLRIHNSNLLLASEDTATSSVLNQRYTNVPADTLASHQRYKMLWTAAKITSISLFLIGSIAGVIALSILNPGALFFFAVGFATGIQILAMLNSWFDKKIAYHEAESEKFSRITAIYEDLKSKDEYDLEREFDKQGVSKWDIQDLDKIEGGMQTLAIGLAHLIYTNETTDALKAATDHAQRILETESDSNKKRSAAKSVFLYEQAAAISRLHAAHDLYLLFHPFNQKNLSEIGSFANRNVEEVLLDRQFVKEDNMFLFNNPLKNPITFDELNNESLYCLQSCF